MSRNRIIAGLMGAAAVAAALAGMSLATASPAAAFGGYGPRVERPYGWRPAPPPFYGFAGPRHWRRYEGYGFRRPPPPPYGYGWR